MSGDSLLDSVGKASCVGNTLLSLLSDHMMSTWEISVIPKGREISPSQQVSCWFCSGYQLGGHLTLCTWTAGEPTAGGWCPQGHPSASLGPRVSERWDTNWGSHRTVASSLLTFTCLSQVIFILFI